jgi:hypothetical protein
MNGNQKNAVSLSSILPTIARRIYGVMWMKRALLFVGIYALNNSPSPVGAQINIRIFNTGVDDSNRVLLDGEADPHWLLASGTAYAGAGVRSVWVPNSTSSRWLTPAPDGGREYGVGTYIYSTQFTLGSDLLVIPTLNGRWSSDNRTLDIRVNGSSSGYTSGYRDFDRFTPFSLYQGLHFGTNTIEFVVSNQGDTNPSDGGPTGLRVEWNQISSTVPEPSSIVISVAGTIALSTSLLRMKYASLKRCHALARNGGSSF